MPVYADESWGDPDHELEKSARFSDYCPLCGNFYENAPIDQVFCDDCEKKPMSKKEAWHKDNSGDASKYNRIGDNAPIPHKVGGTWYGGHVNDQGWDGKATVDNYKAALQYSETESYWNPHDKHAYHDSIQELVDKGKVDRRTGARFLPRKVA